MDAIKEILDLGGYGAYVWPAFATWAAVMTWMAVSTLRRLRASEDTLEKLQAAGNPRRRAAGPDGPQGTARP
ncbi:MAG: heme exporter protein CcmD [Alphaproteobacteria bacterium]|nr:heme exporter protein CcmD [Alphaproteobacteria bacterium]